VKNNVEIFDLEKTKPSLEKAEEFVKNLAKSNKMLLLVGGKKEASDAIQTGAQKIGMPAVFGRWVGGTLTNFANIRARVDKMLDLIEKREKGELAKYTKKERLLIDREIARLQILFGGLVPLKGIPGGVFVVDPGKEHTSVTEARKMGVPVVALASSDCDFSQIDYVIPGNDASRQSIAYFVDRIAAAYESGKTVSS
jgi:small subunit ribosomal protein S2